jgi:hypothetical protein
MATKAIDTVHGAILNGRDILIESISRVGATALYATHEI